MHIGDLNGYSNPLKRRSWQAIVTVTVNDTNNNLVEGATVTGHWSGKKIVNASCVTEANGQCALTSGEISTKIESMAFTVDDVTHTDLTYNEEDNHETSITVFKP